MIDGVSNIDVATVAALAVFAALGLKRGISGELANAAGLIAGVGVWIPAGRLAAKGVALFPELEPPLLDCMHLASTAILCVLAFGAVYKVVNKTISLVVPQPSNAILGFGVGALKGLVLSAAILGLLLLKGGEEVRSAVEKTAIAAPVGESAERYLATALP